MKPLVLVTDRFSQKAAAFLSTHFEVKQTEFSEQDYQSAQALIIRSRTQIHSAFLDQMPQLKLIITCTSGYDHIDFEATQARKIQVSHTPDANAQSTAELTWLLLLNAAREFPQTQKMIHSKTWTRTHLKGIELFGKTMGIVGYGRVGKKVAQIAKAFNMNLFVYDPYIQDEELEGVQRVGYTELLRLCQIVSFHVPYTQETHHMFNRRLFGDMLDGSIILNACRGDVMNEQDLLYGLEIGKIKRLGLDVFSKEPLDPHSPLLKHPKVICTPHIGATTEFAFESSSMMGAQKCLDFFANKPLQDKLPYDKPWWNYTFRRS